MKKISARVFFTVLWRGVCQFVGLLLSPFGYKRDGKFAKVVWGLFATSAAVVMFLFAAVVVHAYWNEEVRHWDCMHFNCDNPYCYSNTQVKKNLYFHRKGNEKGYIYNIVTGEKFVKHVEWIAQPIGKDSLVCFSNGKKRGYFNKNTGKLVVEPKYDHAWIFSEGLACVEEGGCIKFIDATGKVVIDKGMAYVPDLDGYVFHGGYCIVGNENEEKGLIDKTGKMVLPIEYNHIYITSDLKLWCVQKGEEMAVYDKELKPVLPLAECSIYIGEGTIDVTLPDHTMRKFDMNGSLINDFYISSIRSLEYEKDEVLYRTKTRDEEGDEYAVPFVDSYRPQATARLRAYVAGDGYEGLMTADGHVVMMPLYKDIVAIGHDLYLCTSTNYDKVIVNGKGEIVR